MSERCRALSVNCRREKGMSECREELLPAVSALLRNVIRDLQGLYYSMACFPHAGTVETKKARNTHAIIEIRVFIAHCWVTPRSLLRNAELNISLLLVATQQ
jgi:hypothetical protein